MFRGLSALALVVLMGTSPLAQEPLVPLFSFATPGAAADIDRFSIAGRPPLMVSCGSGTRPGGTSPRA